MKVAKNSGELMTRRIDDYIPGQSPLPPAWKKDLIPPINSYEELNEHESLNIQQAIQKYQFGGRKKWPVSDLQFVKRLHREMYGDVWNWAGEFAWFRSTFPFPGSRLAEIDPNTTLGNPAGTT